MVTASSERARVAQEGIAACEQVLARHPRSAQAHYYLAMDLGQLARTKSLGALRLLGRMETEYLAARNLDENYDNAGADRGLGLLYSEAPSFSVGSRSKAKVHPQNAVKLAPDYPENRLNLLEAYLKWGDRTAPNRKPPP